ncbi:hypothetical protein H4R19_005298, partial [Coemansia spiralis]
MEHLAKAAVKISRDAVLTAWEESGQDRMPLAAGQRGFSMDLLDDDGGAALIDEDEDIPPDLYENSALGLHQNQRVAAGREDDDHYLEDDLMEEDYDDEMFDDGNSSLSDLDTEDEAMEEEIALSRDAPGDSDAMEMDAIMHEGHEDDELDQSDESGDEDEYSSHDGEVHSGVDYGTEGDSDDNADGDDGDDDGPSGDSDVDDEDAADVDGDLRATFRLALGGAMRLLQEDDEHELEEEEADIELYGSGLDGDAAGSSGDDHGPAAELGDEWRGEFTGAHAAALASLGRHLANRRHGRSRPDSAGREAPAARGARDGSRAESAANDLQSGPDSDDDGDESSDESSDDSDPFAEGFPDQVEVTMEAIGGHDHGEGLHTRLMPANFLDTLMADLDNVNVQTARRTGVPLGQMAHGRPLGIINGLGSDAGAGFELGLPRLSALGRSGLAVGGVGSAGQNMAHPLLERGENADRNGMQARAERVARGSLSGPLRGVPDDPYEMAHSMATRMSQAFSGRRPVYTQPLIPGTSSRMGPSPWTQESAGGGSAESSARDNTVEGALNDPESPAAALLEQLVRMAWAAAAIDGYVPLSTVERWQEEARMQFGGGAAACAPWIANAILNTLIPEAICQGLLKTRYQIEVARRTAIIDRRRMEEEDEERRRREESA